MQMDFVGELAGEGPTIAARHILSYQVEPESERIFKCFDHHDMIRMRRLSR
jgi:hypothetical protein